MKRPYKTNLFTILIPCVAACLAVSAVTYAFIYLRKVGATEQEKQNTSEEITHVVSKKETDVLDYISETNYTGRLSQYPELYQIPFRKSDAYICNKDFSEKHKDIFEECEKDAAAFLEALFNVDYRTVAEDPSKFVMGVMKNADPEVYIAKGYDTEEERCLYLYDYIKELSDYFVENQVEMEAKFYTDDSLVYSDFYTFVRGELVFTIYSSEDPDLIYEPGKEYQIPVEVAMHRMLSNPSNRGVCSFGKAEDTTFFLTP